MMRKALTEPWKILFYGYFYLADLLRTSPRPRIAVVGDGHTRPNLTWKIFRLLGIKSDPSAKLKYVHIDDTLVAEAVPDAINGECVDISKSRVETVFQETFGYALALDPLSHVGAMVEKSEINALHDGRVIDGPIAKRRDGYVYQRLIDNSTDGGEVMDLRPCVIGDEIPFVYLKYRPIDQRFSNDNSKVSCCPPQEVFSAEEMVLIVEFCRQIRLDVGELDVLRDRATRRIYIVDVAKTPHSPGDRFINWDGIRCMQLAAQAFARLIESQRFR